MEFKKALAIVLCFGIILMVAPKTFAGEIDILVDKLVEKGILSRSEANEILTETKAEVKRQIKEVKHETLPKWLQRTKLKGDFRLRYESKKRKGTKNNARGRIRYRLGIESRIVDQVTIGAGLASGSDSSTSSRSTNQDLENAFSTKPFSLDYAYAEYSPTKWLKMIGGKFKRKKYFWEPGDLLWDTDINPEGGSLHLSYKATDNAKLFMNAGVWNVDQSDSDTSDPYMYYFQPGVEAKNKDLGLDAKATFNYVSFESVRGTTLDDTEGTNTLNTGNTLEYTFNTLGAAAEVGVAKPFDLPIQRVAVFGEYVHNQDPDDENNGWLLGAKFGDKKTYDKNKWQLKYIYAVLQKDAWPDAFPDADRYGGGTDIVSHEGILQYGLNKNIMVEFDYYHSNKINAASNPENVFQASSNFKF